MHNDCKDNDHHDLTHRHSWLLLFSVALLRNRKWTINLEMVVREGQLLPTPSWSLWTCTCTCIYSILYTCRVHIYLHHCSHKNKRHHSNWVVRTQVNIRFAHGVYSVPRPHPRVQVVPTVRAEGSMHCQNLLDWAFQVREQNMVKVCKKHEAIDGLFTGIQPTVWGIRCQKFLGRAFQLTENTVKAKSTIIICMPAVVQASQTTPNRCLQIIHTTV